VQAILDETFRPFVRDGKSKVTIWGIPVEVDSALPVGAWYLRATSPHH
jgi:hypothetical protein